MAYGEIEKLRFLKIYLDNACNVSKSCKDFQKATGSDFHRDTFYTWMKEDPAFAKREEEVRIELAEAMEQNLVMQGLGKSNIAAMIFFLKNKHPAYKEKLALDGMIKVSTYEHLTEEQLAARVIKYSSQLGIEGPAEGNT